jgi:WD40 repeat protein
MKQVFMLILAYVCTEVEPLIHVVYACEAEGRSPFNAGNTRGYADHPGHKLELASALKGHTDLVECIAFSTDGNILASGSLDGTIRTWSVATGTNLRQIHTGNGSCVAFSPNGKMLASLWWSGPDTIDTIKLWDAATGEHVMTFSGHIGVKGIAFTPDGKSLASASGGQSTIKLWDVDTGKNTATLEGHTGSVLCLAFSPDGKTLASGADHRVKPGRSAGSATIKLWDVATRKNTTSFDAQWESVMALAFSPDGKTLASGGSKRRVRLWDVATGKNTVDLDGHGDTVSSVAFSPDGKILASGSWDKTIMLWDVSKGRKIATLQENGVGPVYSVAFSPDGKTLASGGKDKAIRLWRIK